jgi:hypothetical protein
MKTVYQACDGETFVSRGEAAEHEAELFDSWLDSLLDGRAQTSLTDVVHHFNSSHHLTCEGDEHHMTPWDRLKEALRTYWEDELASLLKHTTQGAADV